MRDDARGSRARRGARWAVAVLTLLVVAGCVRGEYAITIEGETTAISGSVVFLAEDADDGHDCSDWWTAQSPFRGSEQARTQVQEIVEDDRPGCRFTLSDRTENLRNADGTPLITREGDTFVLTVPSSEDPTPTPTDTAGEGGPRLTLAITFPGPVLDGGGGVVDGRTVLFSELADLQGGIRVVGDVGDTPAPSSPLLPWVVGGVIVLGLVAVVVVLVLHRPVRGRT